MQTIKTDGIVLRHTNYKDYDRIVTLLTRNHGVLSFSARSCRKAGSRNLVATELFSTGEFVLSQKGERYTLTSFQLSESYFPLREDFERLSHGVYWLNLCEAAVQPGESNERLYKMLLLSLAVLTYGDLPLRPLTVVFLLQFAMLQGYAPSLHTCVYCGKQVEQTFHFDTEKGGICCGVCAPKHPPLLEEELHWLWQAQKKGPFMLAGKHALPQEALPFGIDRAFEIIREHVECRIERKLQSGRFI